MNDFFKRSGRFTGAAVAGLCALAIQAGPAFAADRSVADAAPPGQVRDLMHSAYGEVDNVGFGPISVGSEEPEQLAQTAPQAGGMPPVQVAQADDGVNDPLEGLNRVILDVNEFLYALILRPAAEIYVLMIPDEARDSIRNALDNLRSPVVLANDILQGEGQRAWETTQRMVINSTVGVGGLFDVAEEWGIEKHSEDLGQTFATWGVGEGFYLVLPIFGPSNPRDAVGKFLDGYLDPLAHYAENTNQEEISYTRTLLGGVDEYSRVMDDLQKLKETSVDYYAALRSVSRQKRLTEIRNGKPEEGAPVPDLKYDFNVQAGSQ